MTECKRSLVAVPVVEAGNACRKVHSAPYLIPASLNNNLLANGILLLHLHHCISVFRCVILVHTHTVSEVLPTAYGGNCYTRILRSILCYQAGIQKVTVV